MGGVPACLTPNTWKSPWAVVRLPPAMSASELDAGKADAGMFVVTSLTPGAEIVNAPVGAGLGATGGVPAPVFWTVSLVLAPSPFARIWNVAPPIVIDPPASSPATRR